MNGCFSRLRARFTKRFIFDLDGGWEWKSAPLEQACHDKEGSIGKRKADSATRDKTSLEYSTVDGMNSQAADLKGGGVRCSALSTWPTASQGSLRPGQQKPQATGWAK